MAMQPKLPPCMLTNVALDMWVNDKLAAQLKLPLFEDPYPGPPFTVPDLWVNMYGFRGSHRPGMLCTSPREADQARRDNPAPCLYRIRIKQKRKLIAQ